MWRSRGRFHHFITIANKIYQADAEEIKEAGTSEFTFKLHGHKHKFDAQTGAERDSWVAAVKKIADEAKAKKDEQGDSAVEYGLLVAGIAATIVIAVFAFGDLVSEIFTGTEGDIRERMPAGE